MIYHFLCLFGSIAMIGEHLAGQGYQRVFEAFSLRELTPR